VIESHEQLRQRVEQDWAKECAGIAMGGLRKQLAEAREDDLTGVLLILGDKNKELAEARAEIENHHCQTCSCV